VVTSISVLEHGVDLDRAFAEFARVLKPNGDLAISTDYCDPFLSTADVDRR
jgi:ubiquinone/menaquinone biosynthesis C-methylase UbiE